MALAKVKVKRWSITVAARTVETFE